MLQKSSANPTATTGAKPMSTATSVSLAELTQLLNEDLSREYSHLHFYLHASIVVRGLHRDEW